MSEIKSTRASKLISYGALSQEYARRKCGYSLVTTTKARDAVIIAEQEAEERHTKQLQELNDRAVEAFKYSVCQSCTLQCTKDCRLMCYFIQKLTEKQ